MSSEFLSQQDKKSKGRHFPPNKVKQQQRKANLNQSKMKFVQVFVILFGVTANAQSTSTSTCNRNGGSAVVFMGECNSTQNNQTYTAQCDLSYDSETNECTITSKKDECGCQIIYDDGSSSGVGGGTKDCPTACIDVSDDVPMGDNVTCKASGSAMSFEGRCDSRNHTWTSDCLVEERSTEKGIECFVESTKECGCLYWQNDAIDGVVVGIEENPSKCDACAVHGYPPKDTSGGVNSGGRVVLTFGFLLVVVSSLL